MRGSVTPGPARPARDDFDAAYYAARGALTWEVLVEVEKARPHLVGRTILDVAAGSGRHGHLLRYYGFDVTTTDLHDNGLPGHVTGDFFDLDLHGPYDTVTAFHFIEHLPLPALDRALARMRALAARRVVLVMPHPRHRDYDKDATHAHVPLRDIRAAVDRAFPAGVREERYHNLVPHPVHYPHAWWNLARRIANPRTFTNVMYISVVGDAPTTS